MLNYYISKVLELFTPSSVRKSVLDKSVWVGVNTQVVWSSIQFGTYIGKNSQCLNTDIGKFCSIANNCIIGGPEHPTQFVSTSPVFYGGYRRPWRLKRIKLGSLEWNSYKHRTIIGNDVWIGNNVIIKSGISIGSGAVIGAGAVVTKDIPPYEIWAGVPAKKIKNRFSEDIVSELLRSAWWDLSDEKLKQLSQYMDDPELFLSKIEEKR